MGFETYTVSFFGHRFVESNRQKELEEKLEKLITDLINQKQYVEFLVSYGGDFDTLVSSSIRHITKSSFEFNKSHILVLPYIKAAYKNNSESFLQFYDEVEICEESSVAHPKQAIQICNKRTIDRSDLAVFYIERKYGGAYLTYKYAEKQGIKTINLGSL